MTPGPVAQLVEHRLCKSDVASSSLAGTFRTLRPSRRYDAKPLERWRCRTEWREATKGRMYRPNSLLYMGSRDADSCRSNRASSGIRGRTGAGESTSYDL